MSPASTPKRLWDRLAPPAYDAYDAADLATAARRFARLRRAFPEVARVHYMLGLCNKYLGRWRASLRHNLRALELVEEFDEAAAWNAGIAATALGNWPEARRQWASCGIPMDAGDGPVELDLGVVVIRLNPWRDGETVYAQRIDVVRARLLNVPLPESGYRLGDIVLHDGASTGTRDYRGSTVPVFNALQRLQRSPWRTYIARVEAEAEALAELESQRDADIIEIEDWTRSIRTLCRRCSHGIPHDHPPAPAADATWQPARTLGIAAGNRQAVKQLLASWADNGSGRVVHAVERGVAGSRKREFGRAWWLGEAEGDAAATQ